MKAVLLREFGSPDVLRVEDFPTPVPGAGEVLVEVHAVSVNRTLDLVLRSGKYAKPVELPHILGVDPSGVITAVGEGVTDRKVGDRVITLPWRTSPTAPSVSVGVQTHGGYAEYVKLPAAATVLVPDAVDFATATVVGRHAPAAYTQIRAAGVKEGEWVLIMGAAGGLGSAAIQVAHLFGAKVIAAAGADERVKAAIDLGADAGVNYRSEDLAAKVKEITGGAGANVVLENIGDPQLFTQAFNSLARFGRMVTSGAHAGGKVELDLNKLYLNQITIIGKLGASNADAEAALKAAAEGKFKVLIDRILPLSEAALAHRLVDERGSTGKVILNPRL